MLGVKEAAATIQPKWIDNGQLTSQKAESGSVKSARRTLAAAVASDSSKPSMQKLETATNSDEKLRAQAP